MGNYKVGDVIRWEEIDNLEIGTVLTDVNGVEWKKHSNGPTKCKVKVIQLEDIHQLLDSTFGNFTIKRVGRE